MVQTMTYDDWKLETPEDEKERLQQPRQWRKNRFEEDPDYWRDLQKERE